MSFKDTFLNGVIGIFKKSNLDKDVLVPAN